MTLPVLSAPEAQPALLDDPSHLEALSESEFREACREVFRHVGKKRAEYRTVIGTLLVQANQRWDKAKYTEFVEEAAEITGYDISTLWRWRRAREAELGIAPERGLPAKTESRSRFNGVPISQERAEVIDLEEPVIDTYLAGEPVPDTDEPEAEAQRREVERRLARLREIRKLLGVPEGPERERLYDERVEHFAFLVAQGVTHVVIAEAFGVSPNAVGDALRKARLGIQSGRGVASRP